MLGCTINTPLLPCKAYYFLFLAALASLLPYLPLYMKFIGLDASQSAIIYGSMPFISFFIRPIWCMLADKFHKHKLALVLTSVFGAVFILMCLLIPRVPDKEEPVHVYLLANNSKMSVSKCNLYVPTPVGPSNGDMCQQSAQDGNYLHLGNHNCSLTCNRDASNSTGNDTADKASGIIQFCNQRIPYCSNYTSENSKLDLQNVSLQLDNFTSNIDCPIYAVNSFEVNGSEFDSVKVKNPQGMKCDLYWINNYTNAQNNNPDKGNNGGLTFGLFFLLYLLSQIFQTTCLTMADAMSLSILTEENRTSWGRTRVFGTIGWALFAVISGLFMDSFSESESDPNFMAAFSLSGSLSILAAVSAAFMNVPRDIHCSQMMKNLSLLFKSAEICIFLFIMLIFGMYSGAIMAFLFWYLGDLCSPKVLMGTTLVVECAAEAPMLYFSGWIINKIGHRPILYITLVVYSLRFGAYSFLTNPWYVFLIEPTHGITYGLLFAAATEYTDIIAPAGMSATLQGLVGGIHWSLGFGIGSLVAGQLYNRYGGVVMFRCFAVSALVVLIIVLPMEYFMVGRKIYSIDSGRDEAEDY